MFSILTYFFKNTTRKKYYTCTRTWDTQTQVKFAYFSSCIINFVGQVRDHIFLIISNGHRRSSRSRKMFAMRSWGTPSIVKFAKVKGSSSLSLSIGFWWSLENRKWDRSLLCKGSSFSEGEPEPWTPSPSRIHCSWCSINLSDGHSSPQISQGRATMLLSSLSVSILSRES